MRKRVIGVSAVVLILAAVLVLLKLAPAPAAGQAQADARRHHRCGQHASAGGRTCG